MKAILLSRVSSKEQEEGYSIAAQTNNLKNYCLRYSLDVLKVYEITESSTVGDRKQFREMLDYVKAIHKETGECIAVVVDKVDRLMRNFTEQPVLNQMVNDGVAELHFASENSVIRKESNSQDKMFWNFRIMMAQAYVDALRDNVKRSVNYKIGKGEYVSQAPIGYVNIPRQTGKPADIVADESRAFLVRLMFQEYATGANSLGDMVAFAKKIGLTNSKGRKKGALNKCHIHRILRDPFYTGIMTIKGRTYPHRYPKLVDEALFRKCQEVMDAANKKPFKYATMPFLFRGLLHCKRCGCAYSSYTQKGRYTYLRPTKSQGECICEPLREEAVLDQLMAVFKSIEIPAKSLEGIRQHLSHSQQEKEAFRKHAVEELRKEYDHIAQMLDGLVDLLTSQRITLSVYDKKVQEYKQRQYEIDQLFSKHTEADEVFYNTLSALVDLTSRAYEVFQNSQIERKRQLINFMFANLEMDGKNLNYSMRSPFNLLAGLSKTKEWRARRDSNS